MLKPDQENKRRGSGFIWASFFFGRTLIDASLVASRSFYPYPHLMQKSVWTSLSNLMLARLDLRREGSSAQIASTN